MLRNLLADTTPNVILLVFATAVVLAVPCRLGASDTAIRSLAGNLKSSSFAPSTSVPSRTPLNCAAAVRGIPINRASAAMLQTSCWGCYMRLELEMRCTASQGGNCDVYYCESDGEYYRSGCRSLIYQGWECAQVGCMYTDLTCVNWTCPKP